MKIKRIAKKIYTSPLLITKFFKKSKIDNFVGGLIFGALFSLLVNVVTVQIQEAITRQKYIEALENEIVGHFVKSNSEIKAIADIRNNNEDANIFSFINRYDTSVWDSGEVLGYVYSLDPNIQAKIVAYFPSVKDLNRHLDNAENQINQISFEYTNCLLKNESIQTCSVYKKAYDGSPNLYEETKINVAKLVNDYSYSLIQEFHPTQDRLNNPFLRLVMGSKALESLKRPEEK